MFDGGPVNLGEGRFTARTEHAFWNQIGPYGGWIAALSMHAMRQDLPAALAPRSFICTFVDAVQAGEFELQVDHSTTYLSRAAPDGSSASGVSVVAAIASRMKSAERTPEIAKMFVIVDPNGVRRTNVSAVTTNFGSANSEKSAQAIREQTIARSAGVELLNPGSQRRELASGQATQQRVQQFDGLDVVTAPDRAFELEQGFVQCGGGRPIRTSVRRISRPADPAHRRRRGAAARVRALLDALHPRTGNDAGLWRLPDGDAAFALALRAQTTTTLGADEIHDIGLREVSRIGAKMDRVLQGIGRREGSVRSRMSALSTEQHPPAGSDPRAWMLARHAEYVREAQARSARLFKRMPATPVEVRREPELTERTAAARYTLPAPDGSRPGIFWIPLPGPMVVVVGVKSVAIHEAVPGHHFQRPGAGPANRPSPTASTRGKWSAMSCAQPERHRARFGGPPRTTSGSNAGGTGPTRQRSASQISLRRRNHGVNGGL